MPGKLLEDRTMPRDLWTTPDILQALARRDVGHLFRKVQQLTGASQTRIGVATGLSQAQVSEIMSGKRQVTTLEVAARIVEGLAIPDPARTVLLLGNLDHAAESNRRECGAPPQRSGSQEHQVPPSGSDAGCFADVEAIFGTRSEFAATMSPHTLFDKAKDLRVAGLSLNLLCQHYGDNRLLRLLQGGAHLRCLFLDPEGEAIRAREREEGYPSGHLSSLTQLNIDNLLRRVRDQLDGDRRGALEVATYDETVRFNITLLDDELCIAQPYLPEARGVDAPTLVIRRQDAPMPAGLYVTFEQVFASLWERGRPL